MKTFAVGNKTYTWDVTDRGTFFATVGKVEVSAPTYDAMVEKARAAVARQKVKVNIPVSVSALGYKTVYLTGRHAKTGEITYKMADGTHNTMRDYADAYQVLSPAEYDELVALETTQLAAAKAVRDFLSARKMTEKDTRNGKVFTRELSVGDLVDRAIAAKLAVADAKAAKVADPEPVEVEV